MRSIGWGEVSEVVTIGISEVIEVSTIGVGETRRTEVTFWIGGDETWTSVMHFGAKAFIGDTC